MVRISASVSASSAWCSPAAMQIHSSAWHTVSSVSIQIFTVPFLIRNTSSMVGWTCISLRSPCFSPVTAICVRFVWVSSLASSTRFVPHPCEVVTGIISCSKRCFIYCFLFGEFLDALLLAQAAHQQPSVLFRYDVAVQSFQYHPLFCCMYHTVPAAAFLRWLYTFRWSLPRNSVWDRVEGSTLQ